MSIAIMSSCSGVGSVPLVSCNVKQQNEVKSGHTLRLELKDMLNSHRMKISQFPGDHQADSEASIEKSSSLQAPHVVSEMNRVLGSEVDELKVGSQQQEQLNLKTKLNFLNAVKGSVVDVKEGSKNIDFNPVRNLHFEPPAITDGRIMMCRE